MESLVINGLNIASLSDDELSERLRILGFPAGPIVDTTRSVYQRKLARMLKNEPDPISDSEEEIINSPSGNSLNSSGSFRYDELRRRPLPRVLGSYFQWFRNTFWTKPEGSLETISVKRKLVDNEEKNEGCKIESEMPLVGKRRKTDTTDRH